jgi:REP element-mobilizing transposase RayT
MGTFFTFKLYKYFIILYEFIMPRKSRLDALGALHHIIVRGNSRQNIFFDDADRDQFIRRLGRIINETGTDCYAWALIPNHFHLLLRTGTTPVATVMRRLLTGHAAMFNRRHDRSGHLFQNRYKSILCDKEPYFLELVRYIHLNPLRAGIQKNIGSLDRFPYCGHSGILDASRYPWQNTEAVLARFARTRKEAQNRYRVFVIEGIDQGRRPDLTGGGLIRSMGGWDVVKQMRDAKSPMKGDERILGDSDFVERVLAETEHAHGQQSRLRLNGIDVDRLVEYVSQLLEVPVEQIWSTSRQRSLVAARSVLCYWAVKELGISMTSLAKRLKLSVAAVSKSVARGKKTCKEKHFSLESLISLKVKNVP